MDITGIPDGVDAATVEKQYAEVLHRLDSAVCTRCKGSGREPTTSVRYDWLEVLQDAYTAGLQRAIYSKARTRDGQARRQRAYDRIREAVNTAREIDLPQPMLAILAGITRAQLNNISTGKAGERAEVVGPGPESMDPVEEARIVHSGAGVPRAQFNDGSRAGALAG